MYAYLVHVNRKRLREVMVSMLGLACSILCHVVCLGMSDAEVIFYLWTTSIVIELVADVAMMAFCVERSSDGRPSMRHWPMGPVPDLGPRLVVEALLL